MLTEIKKTRQIKGEPTRRWFNCLEMDLVVWTEAGQWTGFQLCYDKPNQEKAISWNKNSGLSYQIVDDGELGDGSYKATPILFDDQPHDLEQVIIAFSKYSETIDPEVKKFILQIFQQCQG